MSKRRPAITTLVRALPRSGSYLVAVSGGKDSMVLLDALRRIHPHSRVEVCHVDHSLRDSSAGDARFVAEQCARRGVECHAVKLNEKPASANTEAWAREFRYKALSELRESRGLDWILTAHTANDVAETLLMRLLANKELGSISAIDPRRLCRRPLLGASRQQIDEYASERGVEWVEDPTNVDTGFLRNRVRHDLLPLLAREFEPSIVENLAARAASFEADLEALRQTAAKEASAIGAIAWGSPEWLASARVVLSTLPEAISWRVAEAIFLQEVGYPVGERIGSQLALLLKGERKSVNLAGGDLLESSPHLGVVRRK